MNKARNMQMINNAGSVWHRLWSVRLALVSALLGIASTFLAYIQPEKPALWWGIATALTAAASAVARLIQQPALQEPSNGSTEASPPAP